MKMLATEQKYNKIKNERPEEMPPFQLFPFQLSAR